VINVPTTDLVNEVIAIGNCSGAQVDKFSVFMISGPSISLRKHLRRSTCETIFAQALACIAHKPLGIIKGFVSDAG
jgi:hypothetical protein